MLLQAVEKRMRHLEELNAALEEAAAARLLMQHVAERQLKKEVQSVRHLDCKPLVAPS